MSDDKNEPDAGETVDEAAEQTETRRPSPSASAASRARRIGGGPMPTARATEPEAKPTDKPKSADKPKATDAPRRRATATAEKAPKPRSSDAELESIRRRLDRMRWIPAVLAGALVVAMLAVGVWQSHGVWWGKRLRDTRSEQQQEVLAAAKSCTVSILSYDYRRLPEAQKAASACVTPEFKSQYDQSFKIVQQLAPQKHATLQLSVENGGVQSVSKDGKQWVVLLYGQQAYSDNTLPKDTPQRLDISSSVVTLTNESGHWLVSNLSPTG